MSEWCRRKQPWRNLRNCTGICQGRDDVFIKVIRIRPGRSELLIPARVEICLLSETYTPGYRGTVPSGGKRGGCVRSLKMTIHFLLVPRLRTSGATPPFPFRVFIACVGTVCVPEFVLMKQRKHEKPCHYGWTSDRDYKSVSLIVPFLGS